MLLMRLKKGKENVEIVAKRKPNAMTTISEVTQVLHLFLGRVTVFKRAVTM